MILVYGGAFNPVTKAHEQVVDYCIKEYHPFKIFMVPVSDSYNKANLEKFIHRFNMLEIAMYNKDRVEISKLEENGAIKGSYSLLHIIHSTYNRPVKLVIGSDNFENFNFWLSYKDIVKDFGLIVIPRGKFKQKDSKKLLQKLDLEDLSHKITFAQKVKIDGSSTKYRDGNDLSILDEDVLDYINDNGLYGRG